ncbi:hypothetical protein AABB24_032013 [Solanum stoloniferum]|uniref:Yippee domain-containing protein n=1 Tax=Solanum stoloniferum TaxID=62892 RepID=A0ABD2RXV7_9SOLN
MSSDYFHCRSCGTRVALVMDYDHTVDDLVNAGFFTEVFNVEEAQNEQYILVDGMTLAKTYCVKCSIPLGWKLIAASQPSRSHRAGGFYMRLKAVSFWNDVTLHDQNGGANEQNVDQGGGANEQNVDQGGGTNEQNVDQGGGANERNVDQHGGANEQNADQDEGANEQNANQDGGANEQNVDQHEGANGQNHDQDGGRPMKRPKI